MNDIDHLVATIGASRLLRCSGAERTAIEFANVSQIATAATADWTDRRSLPYN